MDIACLNCISPTLCLRTGLRTWESLGETCVGERCVGEECVGEEYLREECVGGECVGEGCVAGECVGEEYLREECAGMGCVGGECVGGDSVVLIGVDVVLGGDGAEAAANGCTIADTGPPSFAS